MRNLIQALVLTLIVISGLVNAEAILIKNAKIHTLGTLGTLAKADLLIIDGKISSVGIELPESSEMRIIDANGKQITPGIMNASTALGLVEVNAIETTVDDESTEKEYSASFTIAEVIDSNSSLFSHNRINGLTRAMVIPDSKNTLFSGRGSLIKLQSDMQPVVLADNAVYLNYGEKGATISGGTRALALMKIKEMFNDLRVKATDSEEFKAKSSLKDRDIEALGPMFRGEVPVVVSVHKVNDMLNMLAIQKEYSLKMIFNGAEEAWKIADKIAAAKVAVLMNPYSNLPRSFESVANRSDRATLLSQAGVELIFSNSSSHNAYAARLGAGHAVGYGLDWDIALAAVTSTPAKWFGIGNSYGTLEAGMDADLVIWDGDPLEVTTSAEQVFIQGEQLDMVSRQTRLRDRYLNKTDLPPAYSK
jgi:imidazolonepropionase-like amidohydrolase